MDNKTSTDDLLKTLYKAGNIDEYFNDHIGGSGLLSFSEYIQDICKRRGDTVEHIIKRSGIERTYGHQIFNGTRKPSRDKVLQLALGFGMDVWETQRMLKIAEKNELYPKIKRDAMLLYCITHGKGYAETQEALKLYKLLVLGE